MLVVHSRHKRAGFPDACSHPVHRRGDSLMWNPSYQEDDQRRFAGRVDARPNAQTLHPGFAHPLVHTRPMYSFGPSELCLRDRVGAWRHRGRLYQRCALFHSQYALLPENLSFDNAGADPIDFLRNAGSRRPLLHKENDHRLSPTVLARAHAQRLHTGKFHQLGFTRCAHCDGFLQSFRRHDREWNLRSQGCGRNR